MFVLRLPLQSYYCQPLSLAAIDLSSQGVRNGTTTRMRIKSFPFPSALLHSRVPLLARGRCSFFVLLVYQGAVTPVAAREWQEHAGRRAPLAHTCLGFCRARPDC